MTDINDKRKQGVKYNQYHIQRAPIEMLISFIDKIQKIVLYGSQNSNSFYLLDPFRSLRSLAYYKTPATLYFTMTHLKTLDRYHIKLFTLIPLRISFIILIRLSFSSISLDCNTKWFSLNNKTLTWNWLNISNIKESVNNQRSI